MPIKDFIYTQFLEKQTQEELDFLSNKEINFKDRCLNSIESILSKILEVKDELKSDIENDCNQIIKVCHDLPSGMIRNVGCIPSIYKMSSQTVSLYIQNFLNQKTNNFLLINGENSYPDLYMSDSDYSSLPRGSKGLEKGLLNHPYQSRWLTLPIRPNKVPDGLELKATSQKQVSIMTHGPHIGLHFVVQWSLEKSFLIKNMFIGFLNKSKYRTYEITTEADTRKYFFDQKHLISILDYK